MWLPRILRNQEKKMSYIEQKSIDKLSNELSPAIAKDIVQAYTSQVAIFITSLADADMTTRGRIAHTLKGDSPLVGALQLTDLAKALDAVYKEKNELTDEECAELATACKSAVDELNQILEAME